MQVVKQQCSDLEGNREHLGNFDFTDKGKLFIPKPFPKVEGWFVKVMGLHEVRIQLDYT